MKNQIKLLVELQNLDTRLIERSRMIHDVPKRLASFDEPIRKAQEALDRENERVAALRQKKSELETEITENKEHLKKLQTRSDSIKDTKAFQAHSKELETAQNTAKKLETSKAVLMEKLDAQMAGQKAAETTLESLKKQAADLKEALEQEAVEAKEDIAEIKSHRPELANKVSADLYKLYKKNLTGKGGLAVASTVDQMCMGCNMTIMPQLYVRIKSNSELITCPQCGRILYFEEPAD